MHGAVFGWVWDDTYGYEYVMLYWPVKGFLILTAKDYQLKTPLDYWSGFV